MRTGARAAVLDDNRPVWMLETSYPVAAVVGVIHPRILLSSRLLRECTRAELDVILRHEAAHVHHRDNLVRAAMRYLPNPLSLLPLGARLDRAWAGAVEAAADDAAAGEDEERRAGLAGALVRVARMSAAPPPRWMPGAAFYEGLDVEGRVRRLISPGARLDTPSRATWLTAAALAGACAAAAADPVARTLHGWMEAAVRLGVLRVTGQSSHDIVIVGAGAAGLATAIFARRLGRRRGAPARRRRASRARRSSSAADHAATSPTPSSPNATYWGGRRTIIRRVLAQAHRSRRPIEFFDELGVPLQGGSHRASCSLARTGRGTCSNALLRASRALGVTLRAGTRVHAVTPADGGFALETSRAARCAPRAVVLATGGLVPAEDRQRRAAARDGPRARAHDRADHARARAAGARRRYCTRRPVRASRTRPSCRSRSTARLAERHHRLDAVDALRHQRPGRARRSRHWLRATPRGRRTGVTAATWRRDRRFETIETRC